MCLNENVRMQFSLLLSDLTCDVFEKSPFTICFSFIKQTLPTFNIDSMFIIVYIENMYQIFKTENYLKWFKKLRDSTAKYAIILRIERLKNGNFGDSKNVGEKVFELRIDTGKGYRVYFTNKDKEIIILLAGGNKSTQETDIQKAKELAKEV